MLKIKRDDKTENWNITFSGEEEVRSLSDILCAAAHEQVGNKPFTLVLNGEERKVKSNMELWMLGRGLLLAFSKPQKPVETKIATSTTSKQIQDGTDIVLYQE